MQTAWFTSLKSKNAEQQLFFKKHVLMQYRLDLNNLSNFERYQQFAITIDDNDPGCLQQYEKQKLKYNSISSSSKTRNLIGQAYKLFTNLIKMTQRSFDLQTDLQNPKEIDKLVCDLIPEYDFKMQKCGLKLSQICQIQYKEQPRPNSNTQSKEPMLALYTLTSNRRYHTVEPKILYSRPTLM